MNNIKDYREKELKNYVIGNILVLLIFSGSIQSVIIWGIENSYDVWGTIIESALLSSILYIYVFIIDAVISGDTKFNICYFGKEKMPGYTIFSDMKTKLKDDRFSQEDVMSKYKEIYANMPETNKRKYENNNWYKLYDGCKDESKIYTSHKDYLLCRDLYMVTQTSHLIKCLCTLIIQ